MSEHLESSQPENPNADESASLELREDISGDSELEELRLFVGSRADYYLRKWTPLLQGRSQDSGFNWAAFFFAGLWLPYRKMYKATFILFAILFFETIAEEVLFVGIFGNPEAPAGTYSLVGIVISCICGIWGNRWYLSHARKVMSRVHEDRFPGEDVSQTISRRGGVSFLSTVGIWCLFWASLFVGITVVDTLLYQIHMGSVVEMNDNDQVFYSNRATEADAKALGEILTKLGFFGDRSGASVKVEASSGTYVVSFVLLQDAWKDPEVLEFFQQLGDALASDRFGVPLTIDLCNEYFEVQKSLRIESVEPRDDKLADLLDEMDQTGIHKYEEALVKADQGDVEAESLYREAIALWEEILPQATATEYRKDAVVRLASVHLQLGELQQQLGKRSQAEATLRKAINYYDKADAVEPERPLISHNLKVAREMLNGLLEKSLQEQITELCGAQRFADAIDLCVRSIKDQEKQVRSGKGCEAAVWRLAYRLDQFAWFLAHCPDGHYRDTKTAVKHARRATELQPNMGDYWYTLAMVQYRNGDWHDSLVSLDKVKAKQGVFGATDWLLVAMNRHQIKQRKEARVALRKAIEWIEELQRKAEGSPLLRFQYEILRPSIETLRREAEDLIEGRDAAGERVEEVAHDEAHGQSPIADLGLTSKALTSRATYFSPTIAHTETDHSRLPSACVTLAK